MILDPDSWTDLLPRILTRRSCLNTRVARQHNDRAHHQPDEHHNHAHTDDDRQDYREVVRRCDQLSDCGRVILEHDPGVDQCGADNGRAEDDTEQQAVADDAVGLPVATLAYGRANVSTVLVDTTEINCLPLT